MTERRYSDDEVALILREATEAPATSPVAGRAPDGITLDQLKEIAREVGIDPGAVESAARALAVRPAPARRGGLIGATTTPSSETVIAARIPDEKMGEVVAIIRRAMGRQGIVGHELGSLEWRARDALGGRYVSIRPTERGTRVRAFGNFRDGALSVFLGGGVGGGAVLGAVLKSTPLAAALGIGVLPVAAAGALLTTRFLWRRLGEREARALQRVVTDLEREFERDTARSEPAEEAG